MKRANINPATGLPLTSWSQSAKGELFPEPVLEFLNSLPMTTDTHEWCLAFKAGLVNLLPDVDSVAVSIRPTLDLDDPDNDQRYGVQEIQKIHSPQGTVKSRIRQKMAESDPWVDLYNLAKEGHFPVDEYHLPVGIDYYYRGRSHIASILLFRRKHERQISSDTIQQMEKLEPFFVNLITSHIVLRRLSHQHEITFRDVVERVEREEKLSKRESEVAALLISGHTSQEIAEAMSVSKRTVDNHIASIYRKTGVSNSRELTRLFISPCAN